MALTAQQRADIRLVLGWSARFHQTDSRLEQAMNALDTEPEHELQLTDTLANGGLLASIKDIDTKLVSAHGRLKAMKVGSIGLPGSGEITELKREGRRFIGRVADILGVPVLGDYFGGSSRRAFAGPGGVGPSNYIGK